MIFELINNLKIYFCHFLISEKELYMAISNLSYDGDFRMILGENPNKVKNIVEGQVDLFRQLYSPVVNAQSNYMELANGKK